MAYHRFFSVLIISLGLLTSQCMQAQPNFYAADSLVGFDYANGIESLRLAVATHHLNNAEEKLYWQRMQRDYIDATYQVNQHLPVALHSTEKNAMNGILVPAGTNSTCNNLDFETGDLTGWTGGAGINANSTLPLTIIASGLTPINPINSPVETCGFFTLVNGGAANDPYGNFPALAPNGGQFSLRLGGDAQDGTNLSGFNGNDINGCDPSWHIGVQSLGAMIRQTLSVNPSNAFFSYNYAAVLNDGNHPAGEQSYFKVDIRDSLGDTIPGYQLYDACNPNGKAPLGYSKSIKQSADPNFTGSVYFKNWTNVRLNLCPLIGQKITISFSTAGCTHGAHFGYAYIDGSCGSAAQLTVQNFCNTGITAIGAPSGCKNYLWQKVPSGPGIVGDSTLATVSVNQQGRYRVTMTSQIGIPTTIDTMITNIPNVASAKAKILSTVNNPCAGENVGEIVAQFTPGTDAYAYTWNVAGLGMSSTADSIMTYTLSNLAAGAYTVTVVDQNGCRDTASARIYSLTQLFAYASSKKDSSAIFGQCNGTANVKVIGGTQPYTYSWSNNYYTPQLDNLCAGVYTVSVTDKNGCSTTSVASINSTGVDTLLKPIVVNYNTADATSTNPCNGSFTTYGVSGGSPPYTYLFSNASTASNQTGLCPGSYYLKVTDSKGKYDSLAFVIAGPSNAVNDTTSGKNQWPDSAYVALLMNTPVNNCTVVNSTVDSFRVKNVTLLTANAIGVDWYIYTSSGLVVINQTYPVGSPGLYLLVLQVYCNTSPVKLATNTAQVKKLVGNVYVPAIASPTGIGALGALPIPLVYPVPFGDVLHVNVPEDGHHTMELFDLTGRKVLTQQMMSNAGVNTLFTKGLGSGVYFLRVTSTSGAFNAKVVKE